MNAKNIIEKLIAGLMIVGMVAPVLAATVSFSPEFDEARFPPADKLHAECLNTVNVGLDVAGEEIQSVYMKLAYNQNDLQIVDVNSDLQGLTSKIGYDTVQVEYLTSKGQTIQSKKIFTVHFRSQQDVSSSVLSLEKGSHYVNSNGDMIALHSQVQLQFSDVPECNPDRFPPSISLVTPNTNKQRLSLDAHFVFAIRDIGKGVEKKSIEIDFDGKHYSADSQYLEWHGEYLTFYPKSWLPVNSHLNMIVRATDKQQYGGANVLEKEFAFQTANGMLLQNNVSPAIYRKIVKKSDNVFASDVECRMLKQAYVEIDSKSQEILDGVLNKLACDVTDLSAFVPQHSADTVQAATLLTDGEEEKTSVFTILGWTLFGIVLILKMHYYLSYRKHKNISQQTVENRK